MLRRVAAVLVAVLLTGCSLANPFVITREVREGGPPIETRAIADPSRPDFTEASQYAARVKEQYRQALGHQAKLQSWLGIGLIPLSAAAVGLGATGASQAVLALGLAGAAGFGTGSWLLNRPRQAAYVAGIKAVTCAEEAVTPLGLTRDEIARFSGDLETLAADIAKVEKQAATVASQADKFQSKVASAIKTPAARGHYTELITEARDEVAAGRTLVTTGDAALVTGTELKRVVASVGRRLAIAIDKIADTVDGMIVETQRDMQALSTIIGGLGGTYKTLTVVPDGLKPPAAPAARGLGPQADVRGIEPEAIADLNRDHAQLADDVRVLRDRSTDLAAAIRRVSAVVNTVSKEAPLQALEGCGVRSADVALGLSVDPAEPFSVKKPGSAGFVARGGVSPYTATVQGPGDGVTVTQSAPFTPAFTVTASKDAQVGTYVISIFDGSGQIKPVHVSVTEGTPAGNTPATPTAAATPPASLTRFVERVKGQVIAVPDTGVTLKIGEPTIAQGKVTVPAEVDKVEGFKPDAFTREAVVDALQKRAASGIAAGDIVIDVAALTKSAEDKARRNPGS